MTTAPVDLTMGLVIEKAPFAGAEFARIVQSVSRAMQPLARQAFLDAVKNAFENSTLNALLRRIERGDEVYMSTATAAKLDAAASTVKMDLTDLNSIIKEAMRQSGVKTAYAMRGQFDLKFDYINPRAVEYATKHGADLVQVTKDVQQVIRETVTRALSRGTPPYALAVRLDRVVGLTPGGARAVDTFHNNLLDKGMTASRADKLARDYADRLVKQRADVIARTEIMRATNYGQVEYWHQLSDAGLIDNAQVKWITAISENTCPVCKPLNGKTVPLGDTFKSGIGDVEAPPIHPQCRCTTGLVFGLKKWDVHEAIIKFADEITKKGGSSKSSGPSGRAHPRWPAGTAGGLGGQFKTSGKGRTSGGGRSRGVALPKGSRVLASPQNMKHANAIAKSIGGGRSVEVDLRGMDGKSAAMLSSRVRKMSKEFPEAAGNLRRVKNVKHLSGEEMASMQVSYRVGKHGKQEETLTLYTNAKHFSNHAKMSKTLKDPYQKGWHPYTTPKGIVDHELGHVVSFTASPKRNGWHSWGGVGKGWPPVNKKVSAALRDKKKDSWGEYASSQHTQSDRHEEFIAESFAMRQARMRMTPEQSASLGGVMSAATHGRVRKIDDTPEDGWGEWIDQPYSTCGGFLKTEPITKRLVRFFKRGRSKGPSRWPAGSPGGMGGRFKSSSGSGAPSSRRASSSLRAPAKKRGNQKYTVAQKRAGAVKRNKKNKAGVRDQRLGSGQRKTNIVDPRTGQPINRNKLGEAMERMVMQKAARQISARFGGGARHMAGAGLNTATHDIVTRKAALEVKTVSSLSNGGKPKAGMKGYEMDQKVRDARRHGKEAYVIMPVVHVDHRGHPTGVVTVHYYKLGTAAETKRGTHRRSPQAGSTPVLAKFKFTMKEFDRASRAASSRVDKSSIEALRKSLYGIVKSPVVDEDNVEAGDLMVWLDNDELYARIATEDDVAALTNDTWVP